MFEQFDSNVFHDVLSQPVLKKNKVKLREYFACNAISIKVIYNITLQHPVFECIRLQFVLVNTDATRQIQTRIRQNNYAVKTPLIRLSIAYCLNNRVSMLCFHFFFNEFISVFIWAISCYHFNLYIFQKNIKGFPLLSGACFCILQMVF
jgi:hypothetical protein